MLHDLEVAGRLQKIAEAVVANDGKWSWNDLFSQGRKTRLKNLEGSIITEPETERLIEDLKNRVKTSMGEKIGNEERHKRIENAIWAVVTAKRREGERRKEEVSKKPAEAAREQARLILEHRAKPVHWTTWVGIRGLQHGEDAKFGSVWFGEWGWRERLKMLEETGVGLGDTEEGRTARAQKVLICMVDWPQAGMDEMQYQVAKTKVVAYNTEQALENAKELIDITTDVLCLFKSTGDGQQSWIRREDDGNDKTEGGGHTSNRSVGWRREGWERHNMEHMQLKQLVEGRADDKHEYREVARTLSRIMGKDEMSDSERKIVEAIACVGRGQRQKRPEEAILWTVLGLERLACPDNQLHGRAETTKHFIEDVLQAQNLREARKMTNRMYRVRHALAHGKRPTERERMDLQNASWEIGVQVVLLWMLKHHVQPERNQQK